MAGVALPTVGELFKGTFDESLKKLVQPAAVVPAAVLVLLNALVVYPLGQSSGWSVAAAIADLDPAWQAALAAALTLVLGYLILNLSTSILRVATGELWAGTWLYSELAAYQTRRTDARLKELLEADQAGDKATASRLLAQQARNPDDAATAPTKLGNVLAGMTTSLYHRYGIDASALLPHLRAVMAKDEAPLGTQIDEEATALQVLLNVAAVLAFVALEALILHLLAGAWVGAALSVTMLPAAYLFYRAAVGRAESYADAVEAGFDLYRDDLATALGIELPSGNQEAIDKWKETVAWLARDVPPKEAPDKEAADAGITLTASSHVDAALLEARHLPVEQRQVGAVVERIWQKRYVVALTSRSRVAASGYVAVRDEELAIPPAAVPRHEASGLGRLRGEVLAAVESNGAGIVWTASRLDASSSGVLRYELPSSWLRLELTGSGRARSLALDPEPEPRGSVGATIGEAPDGAGAEFALHVRASWFEPGGKVRVTWLQNEEPRAADIFTVDDARQITSRAQLDRGRAVIEIEVV